MQGCGVGVEVVKEDRRVAGDVNDYEEHEHLARDRHDDFSADS
jgi:hypothetical protein